MVLKKIRPIILAGGLGTRLRPRTDFLPKPLLPVNGRPLLWYAINLVSNEIFLPPIISLDYMEQQIRSYFQDTSAIMRHMPGCSMAEAVLDICEKDSAEIYLGISADVLMPKTGVEQILNRLDNFGESNIALFTKLHEPGHKKWEFLIEDGFLKDIFVQQNKTNFERVLLLLTKKTVEKVRKKLGKNVQDANLPENLKKYQTGWNLILKTIIDEKIPIRADMVDIPVCNINVPGDFKIAEEFVRKHIGVHD